MASRSVTVNTQYTCVVSGWVCDTQPICQTLTFFSYFWGVFSGKNGGFGGRWCDVLGRKSRLPFLRRKNWTGWGCYQLETENVKLDQLSKQNSLERRGMGLPPPSLATNPLFKELTIYRVKKDGQNYKSKKKQKFWLNFSGISGISPRTTETRPRTRSMVSLFTSFMLSGLPVQFQSLKTPRWKKKVG